MHNEQIEKLNTMSEEEKVETFESFSKPYYTNGTMLTGEDAEYLFEILKSIKDERKRYDLFLKVRFCLEYEYHYRIFDTFTEDNILFNVANRFGIRYNYLPKILSRISNEELVKVFFDQNFDRLLDHDDFRRIFLSLPEREMFMLLSDHLNEFYPGDIKSILNRITDHDLFVKVFKICTKYDNNRTDIVKYEFRSQIDKFTDEEKYEIALMLKTYGRFWIDDIIGVAKTMTDIDLTIKLVRISDSISGDSIVSLIVSKEKVEEKVRLLREFADILNSYNIMYCINYLSDENLRFQLLKEFSSKMENNHIFYCVLSFRDESILLEVLNTYKNHLSIENVYELCLQYNSEFGFRLLEAYGIDISSLTTADFIKLGFCTKIDTTSTTEIDETISKIMEEYESIMKKASISDLKTMIGREAILRYSALREEPNNSFLPANLAELISVEVENASLKELLLNNAVFSNYFNRIRTIIENEYDVNAIASVLLQYSKMKRDKDLLEMLLGSLNINLIKADGLNAGDNKEKNGLYYIYRATIESILTNRGIDLQNMNPNEAAVLFQEIFNSATKIVMETMVENDYTEVGGLLSQVCTYALNAEERTNLKAIKKELENSILPNLVLTQKGLEFITRNRVKKIVYEIIPGNDPLEIKINRAIETLYPEYNGKLKNLTVLVDLIKNDPRYSERLNETPTTIEKQSVPINPQNYEINIKEQKIKLIMAIINGVNRNNNGLKNEELMEALLQRMKAVEKNLISFVNDEDTNIELLMFQALNIINEDNMSNLLLYYLQSQAIVGKPKDKNGKDKKLNIDNILDYITMASIVNPENLSVTNVLGIKVTKEIPKNDVQSYFSFYRDRMSKRFYRTIPDVSGSFESNGGYTTYKSYELTDPEQLLAGIRMKSGPVSSCFQLGHNQSEAFSYINSSPHGMIVGIYDDKGTFLGRVYGFRKGNTVHFTRFYYVRKFDFATAMKNIANDIINASQEIEYVTCIPFTSTNDNYINGPEVKITSSDLETQEGNVIYTDHRGRDCVTVVASKNKESQVSFNSNPPTEVFYKRRRPIKYYNFKGKSDLNNLDMLIKELSKIMICSKKDISILALFKNSSGIAYGEDWIVIDIDGKEPIIIRQDYGESLKANEYKEIIQKEIDEVLDFIRVRKGESNDDEPQQL